MYAIYLVFMTILVISLYLCLICIHLSLHLIAELRWLAIYFWIPKLLFIFCILSVCVLSVCVLSVCVLSVCVLSVCI